LTAVDSLRSAQLVNSRGGRLSGWSQRGCAAEVGRSRLAATSCGLEWADFARRAAELAALLAP